MSGYLGSTILGVAAIGLAYAVARYLRRHHRARLPAAAALVVALGAAAASGSLLWARASGGLQNYYRALFWATVLGALAGVLAFIGVAMALRRRRERFPARH